METQSTTEIPDFEKASQSQSSSKPSVQKKARKRADDPECPIDVFADVWADWLTLRRAKNAPVTATVIASARSEAEKARMPLTEFLRVWCARGSQGLEADWLKSNERGGKSYRQTDQDAAAARVAEMTGGLVSAKPFTRSREEIGDAAISMD